MKKQTMMISFIASILMIAAFTGIAASIDGANVGIAVDEKTNDLTDILESVLSDNSEVTLEELIAAEEIIQDAILKKIEEPLPGDPSIKFQCKFWKYLIDELDFWYHYYHTLYTSEKVQKLLDCENNIETCQRIEDALNQILDLRESFNNSYNENNCGEMLNEEVQSIPTVESSTLTELGTCPCNDFDR